MNGTLASTTRRADAALAEPVDLDGRDRREVARHERQHARRDHRDEPGEERDRQLLKHRSARAPRRRAARPRGRARAGAGGRRRRARVRDQYQRAERRARRRRAAMPPSGSTHASRSKPCVCGVERIVGPNSATIASRICCSVRHGGDPAARSPPSSRCATAESDSSSVVWHDRADELRLELALARMLACRRRRGRRERERRARPRRRASRPAARSRMPAFELLASTPGPMMCGGTTRPRRSTKNVSGYAGDAPVAERRADAVADVRVVDAVALQVRRARRRFRVERVDADEDDALVLPGARATAATVVPPACTGRSTTAQKLTTTTLPRSEARLEPARRRRGAAGRASARRPSAALVDLLRDARAAAVRDVPDEQARAGARTAATDGDADDAHQTM